MKKKELIEVKKKDIDELKKEVKVLMKKKILTKANILAGKEKNLKSAAHVKRDIAQLMTIIAEKENLNNHNGKEGANK